MGEIKEFEIAKRQVGHREVRGTEANPQILEYLKTVKIYEESDEIPWCAGFVNWCHREAGVAGTGRANARSYMRWGTRTDSPREGDVVVFWRSSKNSWKGHVGFFVKKSYDQILCLGGNQKDKVSYWYFDAVRLLGYRRGSHLQ